MMAEESAHLPVAPKAIESSWAKLRRHSIVKSSPEDVPHYRRASTGSCHDFCKHGRKHDFEVKEKQCIATRSPLSQSSEEDIDGVKTCVPNRRASITIGSKTPRKASKAKLRESVNSRPHISNTFGINEKEMSPKLGGSSKEGELKTIEKSSNEVVKQGESSNSAKMVETSLESTIEPMETTSPESVMSSAGIPSISMVEPVECSSQSTLEPVETLSETIVEPVEDSAILTLEQMVTSSESIMGLVRTPSISSSSKSCEEGVEAASKPTADPGEDLSKSIAKEDGVLSKLTVENLSKSTPKKLEDSPQSPTNKVEAEPNSITPMGEATSKSATHKVETSSKSSVKKLETTSKSTAEKKIAAKKVETTLKSVVKKVVTAPKSTVKKVEVSSTSNPLVRTSSKPSPMKDKQMKASEKQEAPLKSDSISVNPVASMNSSEGSIGQSNSKLKMEKRAASLKVAARKLMTPSRVSLPSKSSLYNNGVVSVNARKHRSLNIAAHPQNHLNTRKYEHKKPGNDVVEEKTLHTIIKTESRNKSFQTDRDAGQMSTLSFRKGKLVEPQSETSTPRRLKFRRATGVGENPMVKVEGLRRSFKRRDEIGNDRRGTSTGPDKVVLKRQGTCGKRDGHRLFNNVIEETAKKLAKIRKSKVKALVGAFETVISLQEKNPSVKTVC